MFVVIKDLLSPREICTMLRITRRTLTRWIAIGDFPSPTIRCNSRVFRWRWQDVEAVLKLKEQEQAER